MIGIHGFSPDKSLGFCHEWPSQIAGSASIGGRGAVLCQNFTLNSLGFPSQTVLILVIASIASR